MRTDTYISQPSVIGGIRFDALRQTTSRKADVSAHPVAGWDSITLYARYNVITSIATVTTNFVMKRIIQKKAPSIVRKKTPKTEKDLLDICVDARKTKPAFGISIFHFHIPL